MCPFDIFYRPTRYYFLRVFRNIIFSPFYKVGNSSFFLTTLWHCIVRCGLSTTLKCVCLLQVLFVDSFLADQLTSQVYDMYIYTLRGKKKTKKTKNTKKLTVDATSYTLDLVMLKDHSAEALGIHCLLLHRKFLWNASRCRLQIWDIVLGVGLPHFIFAILLACNAGDL